LIMSTGIKKKVMIFFMLYNENIKSLGERVWANLMIS